MSNSNHEKDWKENSDVMDFGARTLAGAVIGGSFLPGIGHGVGAFIGAVVGGSSKIAEIARKDEQ